MRLINVETLACETFYDQEKRPPYAILSHVWTADEVTYQNLCLHASNPEQCVGKLDMRKIRDTCRQAKRDGLRYAWVCL